jgi:hypothetical protein
MNLLDRLVGSLVFGLVYTLMYSGPFIALWLVMGVMGSPDGTTAVVLGVLAFAGFLFAAYRAKYAADAWAFQNMTLLEAHRSSWAVVRVHLSFLPVVGRLFENPRDGKSHRRSVLYAIIGIVAIVIIGMAWHFCSADTEWQYIPNDDDSARWWISPDEMRSLIVNRASSDAHYFDSTPGSLCFTYSVTGIPGEWLPVPGHDGLFSVGSTVHIGVALYHGGELPGPVEETVLNRAAALLEHNYREMFGPITVTLTPFQPAKLKAMKWSATSEMTVDGETVLVGATKILWEYSPEWVIQISADGVEDDFTIVDQIVSSFRTAEAPDCLWPEIGRMLADIGGFSDAGARDQTR